MGKVKVGPACFDGRRFQADISVDGKLHSVEIKSATKIRRPHFVGDVLLPLALIPAMRVGADIVLADRVSRRAFTNIQVVQGVLATWYPELTRIAIEAPTSVKPTARRPRASMQFFTGGVDSFYTYISHPAVEYFVYVHDLIHETRALRTCVSEMLEEVATKEGKALLEFESNARALLDEYGDWGSHTHGAALAAIGVLASRSASRLYVPSTHTYSELYPWGSHPVLDHYWGNDYLELVHDGADRTRFQKVAALASHQSAMDHLRVCWHTKDILNCSVCEKCIRTMTSLEILGRLAEAKTFTRTLDLQLVSDAALRNESDLSFSIENRNAARAVGLEDLANAIESSMARYVTVVAHRDSSVQSPPP